MHVRSIILGVVNDGHGHNLIFRGCSVAACLLCVLATTAKTAVTRWRTGAKMSDLMVAIGNCPLSFCA